MDACKGLPSWLYSLRVVRYVDGRVSWKIAVVDFRNGLHRVSEIALAVSPK